MAFDLHWPGVQDSMAAEATMSKNNNLPDQHSVMTSNLHWSTVLVCEALAERHLHDNRPSGCVHQRTTFSGRIVVEKIVYNQQPESRYNPPNN